MVVVLAACWVVWTVMTKVDGMEHLKVVQMAEQRDTTTVAQMVDNWVVKLELYLAVALVACLVAKKAYLWVVLKGLQWVEQMADLLAPWKVGKKVDNSVGKKVEMMAGKLVERWVERKVGTKADRMVVRKVEQKVDKSADQKGMRMVVKRVA